MRTLLRHVGRWVALGLLAGFFGFPLCWTVTMAFKPQAEWNPQGGVHWFPQRPTLDNFTGLLGLRTPETSPFLQQPTRSAVRPIVNSLIAAGGGTVLALLLGVLAAYGTARFRAGGRPFPFLLLQLRMLPPIVLVTPLFFVWVELGLWGTLQGLAIVYAAVTLPFVVWLVRSFLLDVPLETTEAAIVDGCTHWGAFFKTALPRLKGAIATTALFVFVLNWSDLLLALALTDQSTRTAPVFLSAMQGDEFERQFGPQAALALILMITPALIGLTAQRHLTRGLSFGALR